MGRESPFLFYINVYHAHLLPPEPEPDIVTVIVILIVGDELIANALDQLLRIVAMQISMMVKSISARTQKARQQARAWDGADRARDFISSLLATLNVRYHW